MSSWFSCTCYSLTNIIQLEFENAAKVLSILSSRENDIRLGTMVIKFGQIKAE